MINVHKHLLKFFSFSSSSSSSSCFTKDFVYVQLDSHFIEVMKSDVSDCSGMQYHEKGFSLKRRLGHRRQRRRGFPVGTQGFL